MAPLAGALVNRIGERPLIVGGLLLQAGGMAWIAFIAGPDVAYAKLVAPLIVAGAGVSMAMPAAQNAVLSSVAASEIGQASGIFNMLRFLGGAFGIAILGALFAGIGGLGSARAFSAGFTAAIGGAARVIPGSDCRDLAAGPRQGRLRKRRCRRVRPAAARS